MVGAWLPKAGRPWVVDGEEEQLIAAAWNEGKSPATISIVMGGTRSSTVILAHLRVMERRGVKFKFSLSSHNGSDVISRRFRSVRLNRVDDWQPPASPQVWRSTAPVELQDIPKHCCHFPVDGGEGRQLFCAHPIADESLSPYCSHHHGVAFRVPESTRLRPAFP